MGFDPNCPCTPDCPDRPNCKGCVRGNEYRQKRIKQLDKEHAERSINRYMQDLICAKLDIAAKNIKKPKRRIHR